PSLSRPQRGGTAQALKRGRADLSTCSGSRSPAVLSSQYRLFHGTRVTTAPCAGIDCATELRKVLVEGGRLFEVDRMPCIGHHHQCRRRDRPFHEKRGFEARPVLVTGHDERWRRDRLHPVDEIEEGGTPFLDAAHGPG